MPWMPTLKTVSSRRGSRGGGGGWVGTTVVTTRVPLSSACWEVACAFGFLKTLGSIFVSVLVFTFHFPIDGTWTVEESAGKGLTYYHAILTWRTKWLSCPCPSEAVAPTEIVISWASNTHVPRTLFPSSGDNGPWSVSELQRTLSEDLTPTRVHLRDKLIISRCRRLSLGHAVHELHPC